MRNKTKKKSSGKKDVDGREEVFLHVATTRNLRGRFRAWAKEQGMSTTKCLNTLMKIVCSKNFRLKENGFTLSNKGKKGKSNG